MSNRNLFIWGNLAVAAGLTFGCGSPTNSFSKAITAAIQAGGSTGTVTAPKGAPANLLFMNSSSISTSTPMSAWAPMPQMDFDQAVNSTYDRIVLIGNNGANPATLLGATFSSQAISDGFSFKDGTFPGMVGSGACPALGSGQLQPGSMCELVVRYYPRATGSANDTIALTYFDGTAQQLVSLNLFGLSGNVAFLTISQSSTNPEGLQDSNSANLFNAVAGTATQTVTLYVTNQGTITATGIVLNPLVAPFGPSTGAPSPGGAGGTCTGTLAPGQQCTLILTFTPQTSSSSPYQSPLRLVYDDGDQGADAIVVVSGTVSPVPVAATLAITPYDASLVNGSFSFPNTTLGGPSTSYTFVVDNSGTESATSVSGLGFATSAFQFAGGSYPGANPSIGAPPLCGSTIAPGQCSVVVSFSPGSVAPDSDNIRIQYSSSAASGLTASLPIQGAGVNPLSGTGPGGPITSGGTLAFDNVGLGGSAPQSISLSLSGAPVSAAGVGITPTGSDFSVSPTSCSSFPCNLTVTFQPKALGSRAGPVLTVSYQAGGPQTYTVNLTGTGVSPFQTPSGLTFNPALGVTSAAQTVTPALISGYNGTVSSVIPSISAGSSYYSIASQSSCAPYSAACAIGVTFTSSDTSTHAGTLTLTYTTATGLSSSFSATLSGTAQSLASLGAGSSTITFPLTAVNAMATQTLTFTNSGQTSATGISITTEPTIPFSVKSGSDGCTGATVAANGGTCQIVLQFQPTSPTLAGSPDTSSITVGYSNGVSNGQSVSVNLSGTAANESTIVIAAASGSSANFGSQVLGSKTTENFTVTNTGTATATLTSNASAPNGAFSYATGSYPGTTSGTPCGTTLGPNSACSLAVQFDPTAAQNYSSSITLGLAFSNWSGAPTSATLSISGKGTVPLTGSYPGTSGPVTLSSGSTVPLNSVYVGESATQTITITLASGAYVSGFTATATTTGGATDFAVTPSTCSSFPCTLTVTFTPTANGSRSGSLSLSYQPVTSTGTSIGLAQTPSYVLSGTGELPLSAPASLTFTPAAGVQSAPQTVTLNLPSGYPSSALALNSGDPSTTGTGYSISGITVSGASAASCTGFPCAVSVEYLSSSATTTAGTLNLAYTVTLPNGALTASGAASVSEPLTVSLSGTGSAPISGSGPGGPIATGGTLSFPSTGLGGSYSQNVVLSEASGATISNFAASVTGDYSISPASCSSYPCSLTVKFAPTALGSRAGTLTISYNVGSTPFSIAPSLSGTGVQPFQTIGNLSFSAQESVTSAPQSVNPLTISGYNGTITSVTPSISTGSSYYTIASQSGCASYGSGCTIGVTFNSADNSSHAGVLTLAYSTSNGLSNSFTVNLGGSAQTGAGLAATPASVTFPLTPVNGTATQAFTFNNNGQMSASGISITTEPSSPFSIKAGNDGCSGTTVAGGSSCQIIITFAPTSAGTDFSSSFTLTYNNGHVNVSLGGSAAYESTVAIAPAGASGPVANFDYGTHLVGTITPQTFIVANSGNATVSLAATSGANAAPAGTHFAYSGSGYPGVNPAAGSPALCGTSLAANASCSVVVQFQPTAPSSALDKDQITLNYNYSGETGQPTASLPIQGTASVASSIAVNGNHSCMIVSTGALYCFGRNNEGQLGIGTQNDQGNTSPGSGLIGTSSFPSGLAQVTNLGTHWPRQVVAGFWFTCAILDDGSVECWGHNDQGQLGYGNTNDLSAPSGQPINLGTNASGEAHTAQSLAAGYEHVCAILDDNQVKCWGNNSYGQLGLGDLNNRGDGSATGAMGNQLAEVSLGTGLSASQLTASAGNTCALLDNGNIKCWGDNFYGQLGQGNSTSAGGAPNQMGDNLQTINVGTNKTVLQVSAGGGYVCAVLNDHTVKCWGLNSNGSGPTGSIGSCWAINDNDVAGPCWNAASYPKSTQGYGLYSGQMGDAMPIVDLGTNSEGATHTALSVTTGNLHTCALLDDNSVKCWGDNSVWELGLVFQGITDTTDRGIANGDMGNALPEISACASGNSTCSSAWTATPTQLEAGGSHTCALLSNGSVTCWGTIQSSSP